MKRVESILFWRKKIDKINRNMLKLLNRRVAAARKIGIIKKQKGKAIADLLRERVIIKGLLKKNSGPLDDKAIRNIFSIIIKETKRLERSLN